MESPMAVVEKIKYQETTYFVVRDDLLPGGSKQRACLPLLKNLNEQGFNLFLYASPFAGFAQVALAFAAQKLNLPCHLFCEEDKTKKEPLQKHEFTQLAESFGAKITMTKTLQEAETLSAEESSKNKDHYKIPLGFNCIEFRTEFEHQLKDHWQHIVKSIGKVPKRIWLPVGSGTLLSVLRKVIPEKTAINCVGVQVLPENDSRIQAVMNDPQITYYKTNEQFHECAELPPSIPSNIHYDAKLWRFITKYGRHEDLWWNVAR
jgi:1-aminocyclopropane-1-carboxylate deaminase/D-cysteine desulfhydrase-like pyridoxal-dependent ACC family enzyme